MFLTAANTTLYLLRFCLDHSKQCPFLLRLWTAAFKVGHLLLLLGAKTAANNGQKTAANEVFSTSDRKEVWLNIWKIEALCFKTFVVYVNLGLELCMQKFLKFSVFKRIHLWLKEPFNMLMVMYLVSFEFSLYYILSSLSNNDIT